MIFKIELVWVGYKENIRYRVPVGPCWWQSLVMLTVLWDILHKRTLCPWLCLRIFHTLSVITRLDDDTPSFQIVNADDSPDLLSRPKDRVPSLVTIPSRVVRHGSMNHRQLDCPITNQQTWTRYLMIPILYKGSEFFEGHLDFGWARIISAYMRWNE